MRRRWKCWVATLLFLACAWGTHAQAAGTDDDDLQRARSHWAFQPLQAPRLPRVKDARRVRTPIDLFVQAALEKQTASARQASLSAPADPAALLRRLSFDLIGLPPDWAELDQLRASEADCSQRIEKLLASPRYGERWGKHWLDAVGYADSNGYFHADTDRPLAYKYRDYVIRSLNADKPFDQFVREQLAGDEMAGYGEGVPVTPAMRELLTATHFLRNGQDGTGESDGNPDERTVDRTTVLEGTLQNTMNSLLALTIQCARCHQHKFEPISHEEYYGLQAVFYPAFPAFHPDKWVTPQRRVGQAATPRELQQWRDAQQRVDAELARLQREFRDWVRRHRPAGKTLFADSFDGASFDGESSTSVSANWSNTVPGDDAPAGSPPIQLDAAAAPAAIVKDGMLRIIESGAAGDRWLSTKQRFDWSPAREGDWIQVSFDLVADRIDSNGAAAARIGFCLAMVDFHDRQPGGGNLLIDGNPSGGAAVHADYPGADSKSIGTIGKSGYAPGKNYGVRVTNLGAGKYQLQALVDWRLEEPALQLTAAELPRGAFGFEYCCGRSFVVDNVLIESGSPASDSGEFGQLYQNRRAQLDRAIKDQQAKRGPPPEDVAWVTDLAVPVPDVFLLDRGSYDDPVHVVRPSTLQVLSDEDASLATGAALADSPSDRSSSGRRLAFARWLTRPDSRAAALLARVMVNRIWQHHFGAGLVRTPNNFGLSGRPPSHPELLEYLAAEFVRGGWSVKAMHRLICNSAVYQQTGLVGATDSQQPSGEPNDTSLSSHERRLLLACFPPRRLDAEAIRDGMLSVAGELDAAPFGPYVPTRREADGKVVVGSQQPGARRRGIYLQQRRTQVNSFLELFDGRVPLAGVRGQRDSSNVPLQSLAMLNSAFVRARSQAFARRLLAEGIPDRRGRIERAFVAATSRPPTAGELAAAESFLRRQFAVYQGQEQAEQAVWTDFCQMLLASNAFLYLQ